MGGGVKKFSKTFGNVAGKVVDPLNMSKGKIGGALSLDNDFLLGKKQGAVKQDQIAGLIRGAQAQGIASSQKGLSELNEALDAQNPENMARMQVAQQEKGLLTSAQDARRRAQQLMAQRGLSGSSLGLASDRSITQSVGDQRAALQAALPQLIQERRLENAQARMQAGQGLFGGLGGAQGVQFRNIAGQRSGGLLGIGAALAPVAGQVIGGLYGGAPGAMAGGQAGTGLSSALRSQQTGYLPEGQAFA
jgi:hypothetical protein